MMIISYDIKEDSIRNKFAKMLCRKGAIRLQFSVYEIRNSKRTIENLKIEIENTYSPLFTPNDSIVLFEIDEQKLIKYGNAIHRDKDLLFL